jgi:hypothetical protein
MYLPAENEQQQVKITSTSNEKPMTPTGFGGANSLKLNRAGEDIDAQR